MFPIAQTFIIVAYMAAAIVALFAVLFALYMLLMLLAARRAAVLSRRVAAAQLANGEWIAMDGSEIAIPQRALMHVDGRLVARASPAL